MAEVANPRLLLFVDEGARGEADRLSGWLQRKWEPIPVESLTAGAIASRLPAAGLLLLGCDESRAVQAEAVARHHPGLPILALGPVPIAAAGGWIRRPPSFQVLDSLLAQLIPAPTPPSTASREEATGSQLLQGRWRRKGDMILGHSRDTEQLLKTLDRLAPSGAPVLVSGESGTGKELVARALHYAGPRVSGPFIALNCAAIPESLIEAELFGHERGAFTGAVAHRPGAFEASHGGTLFLDEIGEMPVLHQAKLLRVLETAEVTRLGSNAPRKINVRLVAATNRDLSEEIANGRFRQDLYYRLMVYPVHLSPLRDRPEDILPIVHHHLAMIAEREKRPLPRLSPAAVEKLLGYPWPGNVRELLNVLERACLVATDDAIDAEHLALARAAPRAEGAAAISPYRDAKARFEAEYYTQLLDAAAGNISLAAKLAQKTRKEVYDAIKRVGLDPTRYRRDGSAGGDGAVNLAVPGPAPTGRIPRRP